MRIYYAGVDLFPPFPSHITENGYEEIEVDEWERASSEDGVFTTSNSNAISILRDAWGNLMRLLKRLIQVYLFWIFVRCFADKDKS